jgi:hypothetical protein
MGELKGMRVRFVKNATIQIEIGVELELDKRRLIEIARAGCADFLIAASPADQEALHELLHGAAPRKVGG